MVLILAIAAAAITALTTYNRALHLAPVTTASTVNNLRRSSGVVLAFTSAVRSVLDALQMIGRPASAALATQGRSSLRWGQTDAERGEF